jgi:hypothetical protein
MEVSMFETLSDSDDELAAKVFGFLGLEHQHLIAYERVGNAFVPVDSFIVVPAKAKPRGLKPRRVHQPTGNHPGRPKDDFTKEIEGFHRNGIALGKELWHKARLAAIEHGVDVSDNCKGVRKKVHRIYARCDRKAATLMRTDAEEKKHNT